MSATFAGLAGLGDLVLTCTGGLSRNRSLGVALGKGQSLAEWTSTDRSAVEGVNTARAALRLAERPEWRCRSPRRWPRCSSMTSPCKQAVSDLMERALKSEQWA